MRVSMHIRRSDDLRPLTTYHCAAPVTPGLRLPVERALGPGAGPPRPGPRALGPEPERERAAHERLVVDPPVSQTVAIMSSAGGAMACSPPRRPRGLSAARTIDAAEDAGGVTLSEVTPPSEIGDPFEGLVGLGETIDVIRNIADAVTAYGRDALESLHMTFLGNPGVGKTELAHRMAQYYRKQGVIEGGLHKYSASDLICEHVGSAPRLMSRAFDEAAGGILFIDEAYALVQGRGNEFGTESVNTMVECMDDRRHDVIVIAAGYPSEMEQFLAANPGLRDRFGFQMDIKDYTPHQLGSTTVSSLTLRTSSWRTASTTRHWRPIAVG